MAYCWKCGMIIEGHFCGLCGCNQDSRQNTSTLIGSRLRYAYDKLGSHEFLTSPIVFKSASRDMLFDEPEICNQLYTLLDSGFGAKLYSAIHNCSNCISAEEFNNLLDIIQKCAGINITEAKALLIGLLDMVGIEFNISSNVSSTWKPIKEDPLNNKANVDTNPVMISDKLRLDISGVGMADVTFGGSGHPGSGGVLRVFNDRIEFHKYYAAGKFAAALGITAIGKAAAHNAKFQDIADITIRISNISKVETESFIGVYDLVIVLLDGTRYRVYDINAGKKSIQKLSDQMNLVIERRR